MTRLRGLVALVALSLLIVALPWALLRFGDWPLNGLPSGDQLRDLGTTFVSDTAVFAVLTVAAWAVWAVFMVSVLVEGTAAVRGVQAPRLALAGPLQRSARSLVAAIVVAVMIQQGPRPSAAAASPAASFAPRPAVAFDLSAPVEQPAPAPPPVAPSSDAAPADAAITVRPGDSAWSIAETHLGDGMRWRHLWEINRGVAQSDGRSWTDPQIIRVGWRLRIPTATSPTPAAAGSSTTVEPATVRHTVVRGDALSEIADTHLGDAARYTEIFEANRDAPQRDGRRLTDPDLIRPGWNIRLPGEATPAPAVPGPPATSPESVDEDPAAPTDTTIPDTAPSTTAPAGTVPETASTPTPTPTPTATSTIDAPAMLDHRADRSAGDPTSTAPSLAGIAGAVVLASGLALRIRFLRRRQGVRGARALRVVSTKSARTEAAVVAAADVPLVRWAGQLLAQLVAHLNPPALSGAPVAVELSDTAGVELLWDTPQPDAPEGWTVADGGWAWRHAYDPDGPVPVDALPAAIPALVTVGHREGRQLMIDLEAYGAVAVSGADDRVDVFLRSLALELAAGQDLADAYVHAVGFDPGVGDLDRLAISDIDGALRHLDGARQSVNDALAVAHRDGTFAARVGSPTPIEATVVIARAADQDTAERLVQASPAHRGIAVVVTGVADVAPAHIELRDDGTARIEPLGIVFTPVALPTESAVELDDLLDALAAPPAAPEDGHGSVAVYPGVAEVVEGFSTNGHLPHIRSEVGGGHDAPSDGHPKLDLGEPEAPEQFSPDSTDGIEAKMLVRVLGVPGVPDRPDLGRRELILTVLLACRRRPVAASAAQDALWGGKAVEAKTVWNVIGATRKALGDLPDGTPVMPAADRARSTLRVAPGVTTDLAVLGHLVDQATQAPSSEAIRLLREGLELVAGPPFDAAGYDWAHRDQDVAEASTLIEHATERLVELALDAGVIDVARDGIVRGLRGLPGNEELYRCRMRVEHHAGNLAGVSAAYDELVTYLADLETEPSDATTALYRDLVRPVRR